MLQMQSRKEIASKSSLDNVALTCAACRSRRFSSTTCWGRRVEGVELLQQSFHLALHGFGSSCAALVIHRLQQLVEVGVRITKMEVAEDTPLQKKYTSVTFWAERIFFCHTYDTSMTIIVTKHDIIIDVVGSYFYDKKSWQKMGFSSWAGRRRSCMNSLGHP